MLLGYSPLVVDLCDALSPVSSLATIPSLGANKQNLSNSILTLSDFSLLRIHCVNRLRLMKDAKGEYTKIVGTDQSVNEEWLAKQTIEMPSDDYDEFKDKSGQVLIRD